MLGVNTAEYYGQKTTANSVFSTSVYFEILEQVINEPNFTFQNIAFYPVICKILLITIFVSQNFFAYFQFLS